MTDSDGWREPLTSKSENTELKTTIKKISKLLMSKQVITSLALVTKLYIYLKDRSTKRKLFKYNILKLSFH